MPIIISLIVLSFLKKEENRGLVNIDLKRLNKSLKIFLVIAFFSSLGNSTKTILLLKASELGFSPSNVILLYLLVNVANCLISFPAGIISTKIKTKKMIVFSYLLFSIVYLGLGLSSNNIIIIIMFILYGFYMSFIAVSSRTFVSNNSPSDMRATCLGLCNALVSFATLPATIIAGFLWTILGADSAFIFSGIIGMISIIMVIFLIKE